MRTGFVWLKIGALAGSCKQGNELSGSTKDWIFINLHRDYYFLKNRIPLSYN
jgi:hypothetical protein